MTALLVVAAVAVGHMVVDAYMARLGSAEATRLMNTLLRQNAALTAALVHKDGSPVASAIVQTFSSEDIPGDTLRETPQAEVEASVLMGFN